MRTRWLALLSTLLVIAVSLLGNRTELVPAHPIQGSLQRGLQLPPTDGESRGLPQTESDPTGQEGSGGRAIAHRSGGKKVSGKMFARKAPDARLYRTGFTAWEPTMGITENGAIFFVGEEEGNPNSRIIRSTDRAASWELVFTQPITLDPYLYVDPDTSRVFTVDFLYPCHVMSYSDDDGETWTTVPPVGCMYNEDHQTLFSGPAPAGAPQPEGYENVVYLCSAALLGTSHAAAGSVCSKSLDGGDTFVPTGMPSFLDDPGQAGEIGIPGHCGGLHGHGSVGPDGTVYIPRGWCGQPWLAISHDEGDSWERVQVADNGMACCGAEGRLPKLSSHEAGVVADARGNVYYTWVAADRLLYLAVSRDGGETWGPPLMIGHPDVNEALLPGIALGAPGRIAVHYMGTANSPWDGESVSGSYEETSWNSYITMTTDASAAAPLFYSGSINDPREPLWVGACGPDPDRCGWGDFFDVVVARDGSPWAVAVDLCLPDACQGGDATGEGIIGRLVGGPPLR